MWKILPEKSILTKICKYFLESSIRWWQTGNDFWNRGEMIHEAEKSCLKHSRALYDSGTLIRFHFGPQTAEKIAPPFWASQLETGNRHEHGFERLIVKKPWILAIYTAVWPATRFWKSDKCSPTAAREILLSPIFNKSKCPQLWVSPVNEKW